MTIFNFISRGGRKGEKEKPNKGKEMEKRGRGGKSGGGRGGIKGEGEERGGEGEREGSGEIWRKRNWKGGGLWKGKEAEMQYWVR